MTNELPQPKFLSVPEAAVLCGVSRNTVFNWVQKGKLKAYQTPGRTNLIRPSDLLHFMQESGMFVPAELAELAREDAALHQAEAVPAEGENAKPKVLIVDDDSVVRNVITRALRNVAPFYEAETGYQALHLLTLHKDIKVVLLDLHMPGQHGLNTLREIKTSRPDIQVAIVTGYEGEIPGEYLKDGTVARLLRKPFNLAELQKTVNDLLAKV